MALSTKTVGWIVVFLAVALTGLLALQVSLFSSAMELKESVFRRNVTAALSRVSEDLSVNEAALALRASGVSDSLIAQSRVLAIITDDTTAPGELEMTAAIGQSEFLTELESDSGRIHYTVRDKQHVTVRVYDPNSGLDTALVDSVHSPGKYCIVIDEESMPRDREIWMRASDSSKGTWTEQNLMRLGGSQLRADDSGKIQLISRAIRTFVSAEYEPIETRLDSVNLDSAIRAALSQYDIDLAYAYAVATEPLDSLRIVSAEEFRNELRTSDFRAPLFPNDIFAPPTGLKLYFPGRRMHIWGQITPMLGASVFFALIIVASFAYSLRTISRQRRLSELMVDFVNNMTHEFKTPISTIQLASEAIDRDDVITSHDRIRQFNEMIKSETHRMRSQAEQILQMAALEERELRLRYAEIDFHELLNEALDSIEITISARGGNLTRELAASVAVLEADRLHLTNIIHNLLDNANKYSPVAPQITTQTFDSARGLGIRIKDRGVGLRVEDQKRVFEKYFRAPTGNLHDVRGFGLGLSYVKLIVEAHGGQIELFSAYGEGTEVEVILPRKQGIRGRA